MPKPKRSRNPETDITHTIRDLLKLAGIPHSKILQGLGAEKGIADIIGCLPDQGGRMLAIEVKTSQGKSKPSSKRMAGPNEGRRRSLPGGPGARGCGPSPETATENKLKM